MRAYGGGVRLGVGAADSGAGSDERMRWTPVVLWKLLWDS